MMNSSFKNISLNKLYFSEKLSDVPKTEADKEIFESKNLNELLRHIQKGTIPVFGQSKFDYDLIE